MVRKHPVSGTVDISGLGPQKVVVDEKALVDLSADMLNQAELAAVATALQGGDPLPLLRLAGEAALNPFEPADPTEYSEGNNAAVFCNDQDFVWNRTDSIPVRQAKYRAALAALGKQAFAPFSQDPWSDPLPDRLLPAVASP